MAKKEDALNSELKKGKNSARELVLHLNRMGAGQAIIPVKVDGKEYLVEIKNKK